MTGPTCSCGRPVDGATLCRRCAHTVEVALANIAVYHNDLEVSRTKRKAVRYDLPRGKGGSRSLPLPPDNRFLPDGRGDLALHLARNAIITWTRVILTEHPAWPGPRRDTVSSVCAWLQTNLRVIATARWAADCKRDLLAAERALRDVDARGAERIYAGLCTICLAVGEQSRLYALPGDEYVSCPAEDCTMEYRVEDRRDLMRDALEFEWLTPSRIADLATYLQLIGDREWVRKKLNRWHSDGLLNAASVDDEGQPLFPFGEASRLLISADSRRRATRKGA